MFEWPDGELTIEIPEPQAGMTTALLGLDLELPWRYESGRLYVDFSSIAYREIPGLWAWTVRLKGYAAD
jgi:alpha-L-fucosidase